MKKEDEEQLKKKLNELNEKELEQWAKFFSMIPEFYNKMEEQDA